MTDRYTDRIARAAVAMCGVDAVVFVNRMSRLVVDPERFPDEREPMAAVGMGAVYLRASTGAVLREADPLRDQGLLARWFDPYAAAFADLVDGVLAVTGEAAIVDVHSYPSVVLPYELDQAAHRPGVCIGVDEHHTPASLEEATISAFIGVPGGVAVNTPFAGPYVPLRHYGIDPRVRSVMVEIRRDLYMDESTLEPHAGMQDVAARLGRLFAGLRPV